MAPRLTSTVLEEAAMEDFKVSKGEAARFATAIRDVVKEARLKSKAFKAGEKNWTQYKKNLRGLARARWRPGDFEFFPKLLPYDRKAKK